MFWQLFLFELKYRARRPAAYVYFLLFFLFAFMSFSHGALPVQDKEFFNAPAILALYSSMTSIFLMLASSSIMGVPLYRDIEHNTKDYYLSYPITKPGYFWGRFFGSFFFVMVIGSAVFWGALAGTIAGPAFGWSGQEHYQPFHAWHYLYPYLTVVLPNMFFTSALFFGLVAIFRNVKVIYSSGILLFLGYIISNFFFHNTNNQLVIYLSDPFLFIPLRKATGSLPLEVLNSSLVPIRGLLLSNRILWIAVGALILLGTYWRFSFERFFSGASSRDKKQEDPHETERALEWRKKKTAVRTDFRGAYSRRVLGALTRIEILNIVRDNYFWIIISAGLGFTAFLFWHVFDRYGVPDLPRSAFYMDVFIDNFGFFLFFIITFYTGETVHREKLTRYAFINDALPPANWTLGAAKILSLLALALFLALSPVLLGLIIQLLHGYYEFNLPLYATSFFVLLLPGLIEMVFFSYAIQMVVNNKFAGYGIGIGIWVLQSMANGLGYFTYLPLLYGNIPHVFISDMDLAGHMLRPLLWFQGYWLVAGGCLLVIAALYFNRGTPSSFRERRVLARGRYRGPLRTLSFVLLAGLLAVGGFIYYNVNVVNNYLTPGERDERKVLMEKQLKRFEHLPFPTVTGLRVEAELYPDLQKETAHTWLTITNHEQVPVDTFLFDGDNLSAYTLVYNGQALSYQCPLFYPRGKFNFLRPALDSGEYRLYPLPAPLLPGDTALVEIRSLIEYHGFRNELYAASMLRNGMLFNGALPGFGYDEDDELGKNDKRREYGLPEKKEEDVAPKDPFGISHLAINPVSGLSRIDCTIGTSEDQWVAGPGGLQKEWKANGRHYSHFVLDKPGLFPPFGALSARFDRMQARVPAGNAQAVNVSLFYHPPHHANLDRIMAACKDGLQYMSARFGRYPFVDFNFYESPAYGPQMSQFAGAAFFSETYGWNANFTSPDQTDYLYYSATELIAKQWWAQQTAPNFTTGAAVISEGLPKYSAQVMMERKYGRGGLSGVRDQELWRYLWGRRRNDGKENTLLYADDGDKSGIKASIALYGLRDLIGEDSINAALREFHDAFAFRNRPPYPGSTDLYRCLQKHTPDSLQYYLTDTWEKICLYDNRALAARAVPLTGGDYRLSVDLSIGKVYIDSARKEHPALGMKDYIDIGVYGTDGKELLLRRYRFTEGAHTLELTVHGKPGSVNVDPNKILIDRNPEDNRKDLDERKSF